MKFKIKTPDNLIEKLIPELDISLKPHFKEFLETGLVPEALNDSFQRDNYKMNFERGFQLMRLRESYFKKYGFALLNENLLNVVAQELKNQIVVEVGAGTGWLSYNLQKRNIQVTPVELHINDNDYGFMEAHTDLIHMEAEKYMLLNEYDTVLMSWPNYDTDFAANILTLMPKGKTLIYVGERDGGCTGNDRFFEMLDEKCILNEAKTQRLQMHAQSWFGIHDNWYAYHVVS